MRPVLSIIQFCTASDKIPPAFYIFEFYNEAVGILESQVFADKTCKRSIAIKEDINLHYFKAK